MPIVDRELVGRAVATPHLLACPRQTPGQYLRDIIADNLRERGDTLWMVGRFGSVRLG